MQDAEAPLATVDTDKEIDAPKKVDFGEKTSVDDLKSWDSAPKKEKKKKHPIARYLEET